MCDSGGQSQSAAAEKLYNTQAGISQEMFDNWKKTFQPLETQTIDQVRALSDPAQIELRAQTAGQTVGEQYDAAQAAENRRLAGLGINPSDGMSQSANRQYALARAGSRAAAMTSARDYQRTQGLNAQLGLIQTGRGIANSAQAGLSSAASGLAGLGAQGQQQANANNAATGQAIGTAAAMAAAYFF